MSEKDKFLDQVFLKVLGNPSWYADVVSTAAQAFTKYREDLEMQMSYVQLALACISTKDARKLQKTINKELWPKPLQDIIDLRAEGKNLCDYRSSPQEGDNQ